MLIHSVPRIPKCLFSVLHIQVPRTFKCLVSKCLVSKCLVSKCLTYPSAPHIQGIMSSACPSIRCLMPQVPHTFKQLIYPSTHSFSVSAPKRPAYPSVSASKCQSVSCISKCLTHSSIPHNHVLFIQCLAPPSACSFSVMPSKCLFIRRHAL